MPMKFLVFGLFFLATSFSKAASSETALLTATDSIATRPLSAVLTEVEARIPVTMKKALSGPYTVAADAKPSHVNFCQNNIPWDELVRKDVVVFRKRLLLAPELLELLNSGTPSCASASPHQLAVTALLHQLAHLFDRSERIWDNEQDQRELRRCQLLYKKEKGQYPNSLSPVCRYYLKATYKVSESLNYRSLADFKGLRNTSKNELFSRIASPQELSSVHEHFALNLINFLMDSTFSCRRPALNTFFEDLTQTRPFPEASCQKNTTIYTSAGGWKFDIDPQKVYQAHFLFASEGEEIASRWGHSMIRLVTCAPERTHTGPECLEDVAYHVVLSYRANVDDVIVNNWDGLRGKYPSQLMMFSLSEVIEEYTRGQWRDLISLPLNLTTTQKNLLVQSALEHYWSYSGTYKFLSNNCATEADQLIRAVLPKNHSYQSTSLLTPLGMYKDLALHRLIDPDLVSDQTQARALGYYFPNQKQILEKAFKKIKAPFAAYKNIEDFVIRSSAAARRLVYEKMESWEEIGASYLLEKYISGILERSMQNMITHLLQQDRVRDRELAQAIEHLTASSQDRLPWTFAHNGYGIPLANELISDEEVTKRYREGSLYLTQYREKLLQRFPELTQELQGVKENIELLTNRRRF